MHRDRSPLRDGSSSANSRAGSQSGSKHSSPQKSPNSPASRDAKSARASAKPRGGSLHFGSTDAENEGVVVGAQLRMLDQVSS